MTCWPVAGARSVRGWDYPNADLTTQEIIPACSSTALVQDDNSGELYPLVSYSTFRKTSTVMKLQVTCITRVVITKGSRLTEHLSRKVQERTVGRLQTLHKARKDNISIFNSIG